MSEDVRRRYLLQRSELRGLCLPIPVTPKPDESLADLITRAAASNGYENRKAILEMAGCEAGGYHWNYLRPNNLPLDMAKLSAVLGNVGGVEELQKLKGSGEGDIKSNNFSFFGAILNRSYLSKGRRVSPVALQKRLYIRALWNIKPLSFDPETKQFLVTNCPSCCEILSEYTTVGLQYCESCAVVSQNGQLHAVDLRDFSQSFVDEEYWETLDAATGLIDPRPERQERSLRKLHEDFQHCGRGQVFDFIVALGRSASSTNARTLDPPVLSAAADAVLHWPDGFAKFASGFIVDRGASRRHLPASDFFSIANKLSRMKRIPRNVSELMKEIFRSEWGKYCDVGAIEKGEPELEKRRNMRLFPMQLIRKAPDLVDDPQALRQIRYFRHFLRNKEIHKLSRYIGLPIQMLADILVVDLDEIVSCSENDLRDRSNELAKKLQSNRFLPPNLRPKATVRLDFAVAALWNRFWNPWQSVFDAFGDGTLSAWHLGNGSSLIRQTYVYIGDLYKVLSLSKRCEYLFDLLPLSQQDTLVFNGYNDALTRNMVERGMLPKMGGYSCLAEAMSRYVIGREIHVRWPGVSRVPKELRFAKGYLESKSVKPVLSGHCYNLWYRDEAEPHFNGMLIDRLI